MADALYACVYVAAHDGADARETLRAIAQDFSPRYQYFRMDRADLVVIDVSGVERLLGPARVIGEELRRAVSARGVRAHVAVASTQTAARLLAHAQPGLIISAQGAETKTLASLSIGVLETVQSFEVPVDVLRSWGLKTLGDLVALPAADLVARFGRQALEWQAVARGEDVRPLVPTLDDERFESTLELEWPIEGLEPLSFVLTRLLEPLSTRLERRDRGAAVLHVLLRLVTRETVARRLELPAPMREVRALRTLALLDLESHPPGAAIDRVTIVIDPTPGRVVQHRLFTRAQPTPEQLSTLVARLNALMGPDRLGAPAPVDTYRPGAFEMKSLAMEHEQERRTDRTPRSRGCDASRGASRASVFSAVRRCRHPVPARVALVNGRPERVTTDRRGFAGGAVVHCAGPWRTSGEWWVDACGHAPRGIDSEAREASAIGGGAPRDRAGVGPQANKCWNRDEWDVALNDGAVYRVFQDRETDGWFIDAIVD